MDVPERTLVILKPEALEWRIIGEVLQYFDSAGLMSIGLFQRTGADYMFRDHYADVIKRVGPEIGNDIIARMTRGDCIFVAYSGPNAVAIARKLVGATNPAEAAVGTIRNKYGTAVQYNVVHASDSAESANRELKIWFPELFPVEIEPAMVLPYYTGC